MKNIKKYIDLNKKIAESKSIEDIHQIKADADKLYNNHIVSLKINEMVNNMSFGDMKHLFEKMSSDLFKSKGGRIKINEFINAIKENKVLSDMYAIYECICSPKNVSDAKLFLNEALSLVGQINKKELKEGVKNLSKIINESVKYIDIKESDVDSLMENSMDSINESLNYLLSNKKTIKNLSDYTNRFNEVSQFIEKKSSENEINEDKELDELAKKIEEKLNAASNNVNESAESEKNVKKEIFESYKTECINLIESTTIDNNDDYGKRLNEIKSKITQKEYNQETYDADIANLISLKNTLSGNE